MPEQGALRLPWESCAALAGAALARGEEGGEGSPFAGLNGRPHQAPSRTGAPNPQYALRSLHRHPTLPGLLRDRPVVRLLSARAARRARRLPPAIPVPGSPTGGWREVRRMDSYPSVQRAPPQWPGWSSKIELRWAAGGGGILLQIPSKGCGCCSQARRIPPDNMHQSRTPINCTLCMQACGQLGQPCCPPASSVRGAFTCGPGQGAAGSDDAPTLKCVGARAPTSPQEYLELASNPTRLALEVFGQCVREG